MPDVIYTCPMHPQIRLVDPGACPVCGMALEPVDPIADTGASAELVAMRRRFWIGMPLALVVLVLAMGHDIPGLGPIANASWFSSVQFVLVTPVVLWCGWPFLVRGVSGGSQARSRHPSARRRPRLIRETRRAAGFTTDSACPPTRSGC